MPLLAQPGLGQMLPCMPFNSTSCPPAHPPCLPLSLLAISTFQETQRQVQLCLLYTAQGLWPRKGWTDTQVLVTCAKPWTLPRGMGYLYLIQPKAPCGPALALRPGVWWGLDQRSSLFTVWAPAPGTILGMWWGLNKYVFMNYWMD